MEIEILPTDIVFKIEDNDHDEIMCSRCKKPVPDPQIPFFVDAQIEGYEYLFCHECIMKQ